MKVIDVINHLKNEGYWVNFDKTRDIVLYGDTDKEITKIGICWVARRWVGRVVKVRRSPWDCEIKASIRCLMSWSLVIFRK